MALEGFFGITWGYMIANAAKKREELAQGGSEILGAAYQSQGLTVFSSIASRIIAEIPYAPLRLALKSSMESLLLQAWYYVLQLPSSKKGIMKRASLI